MAKYGDLEARPDDGQNEFSDIIKSRSEMLVSKDTVFPSVIKSARLRPTNDFHVNIRIGGLWMPPHPQLII